MRGAVWLPPLVPDISIIPKENLIPPLQPRQPLVCGPSLGLGLSETRVCMESHNVRPLASGLFTWHHVFQVPRCGVCWCFVPFLWLHNIPLFRYIRFCLSAHRRRTFGRFFYLLAVVNNAPFNRHVSVFESRFSVLLGVYLGVELLGHMALL